MSKLIQMQQKRADLAKQMRNMVDNVDAEKGMTADQESQWNQMNDDIINLDKTIKTLEAQLELENRLEEYVPAGRPSPTNNNADEKKPWATDEYRNDFEMFVRNEHLGADVRNNLVSIANTLNTGADSEGGFVVPESWEAQLLKDLADEVLMRQLGTVRTTQSTRNLPIVDDKGAAGWVDELGAYPESDIAFANKQIEAWKLGRIMKVSEEILEDSMIPLEQEIGLIFGETFGEAEELAFWQGDGVKKPRGVLLDAEVGVTAASNAAITYDEIVTLVYSVKEKFRRKSTMVMQDATAGLLRKLKSTDGVPLWQPSLQAGQPDMFLGYKSRTTEGMQGVGASQSPLSFGDFSFYRIGDRGRIFMQRLNEKYSDVGAVGFRMRKRTDGKLTRAHAVKRLAMPA